MKIYISGSITKDPVGSKEKFAKMEKTLRNIGWDPYNPRRHDIPPDVKKIGDPDLLWITMMKIALIDMMKCDALVLLKGWEESKGAKIEYQLAKDLNFKIFNHKLEIIN